MVFLCYGFCHTTTEQAESDKKFGCSKIKDQAQKKINTILVSGENREIETGKQKSCRNVEVGAFARMYISQKHYRA